MKPAKLSIISLAALILTASPALACSCRGKVTADSLLKYSAAVFTGVVYKVRPASSGQSLTTFGIVEAFKGPPAGATIRVLHRSGSTASCGVSFQPGRTYTLSVNMRPGMAEYTTSHCSTWMFNPNVGLRDRLIEGMRAIKRR